MTALPEYTRVVIADKAWWRFTDGTLLPVISGGDGSSEGSDAGDGEVGGGETGGDGDGGGKPSLTIEEQLAAAQADNEKWKAQSRKHEAKSKANAEAAEKLKALENAGKSETEKLQALLAEREAQARTATVKALKLQVAADKGLPAQLAKFLPDLDDEVDMLAAADELLEASGSAATGDQPTRQPKSTLTNPLGDDNGSASRDALINSMLGKAAS